VSRTKWLIVAALALADVVVLGAMAVVVVRFLAQSPSAPASLSTPVPSPELAATSPPTWTPVPSPTLQSTPTPRPTAAPTQTPTPWPTSTPTQVPTPAPVVLENPVFEGLQENFIPGWQMGSFVNWAPGDEFDAVNSYAAPRFHQAGDQRQWINGPTLQIDTEPWVKLRAWVFQTVDVEPGSRVQFQVRAVGFVRHTAGGYLLKAGVDPDGGVGCAAAQWGTEQIADQGDGVVELVSPKVVVGPEGRVTVCAFAETQFAQVYHAAFFDDAALIVLPPARP